MTTMIQRLVICLSAAAQLLAGGCAELRYYNSTNYVQKPGKTYQESWANRFLKNNYYYPIRDLFDPNVRASLTDSSAPQAWNLDQADNVPDGSFYLNRNIGQTTAQQAALAPGAVPKAPWKVLKARASKPRPSFVGQDATGRKFMVKLDDPNFPQAGSAAAIISSRILALLGYYVPNNYIVTIEGTSLPEYDGHRAEASAFVDGQVLGHFKFDWLRYRREIRALRVVCAWLDDLDRSDNNVLLMYRHGKSYYYLLDFDSTLGLWHGASKQPWQGHRHLWDPYWATLDLLSFTIFSRYQIKHRQPYSAAVGIFYPDHFDPLAWKPHHPNSAFRFMSNADAQWIARKIAKITPQQLGAIVKAARYSNPDDQNHVLKTLLQRQAKILKTIALQ